MRLIFCLDFWKGWYSPANIVKTILIVDDDPDMREALSFLLSQDGYEVRAAEDGAEMFRFYEQGDLDLILLDLGLGQDNGLELALQLRKNSMVPIIILSGRNRDSDKVVGLEVGADDYVAKPFNSMELLARIRAVIRRTESNSEHKCHPVESNHDVLIFDGWELDLMARTLKKKGGEPQILTSGEFELLRTLALNPGHVLSREQLLDMTGRDEAFDRSIDVQIMRLRRKIEDDPAKPSYIKAVRSAGYVFTPKVIRN